MALVTAQKRQALRLPTVDATVDSLDKLALLGLFQVETTAPALSTDLKRQILRLPIVDATVDEKDAFALLQTPQTGNTGPTIDVFSLAWTIDPTFSISESVAASDGAIAVTLGSLQMQIKAFVEATAGDPSFIEICDRTGFKMYPWWHPLSELVEDGYGNYVRAKSADSRHPQDYVRSRGNDKSEGPQSAEGSDVFISTSISPEDL